MTQPEGLTHRPCRGVEEFVLLQDMVRERYAVALAAGVDRYDLPWYPSAGDLDWWRCNDGADFPAKLELWFAGEALVAFVWHSRDGADIITAWHARGHYAELLAWAEERAVELAAQANPEAEVVYDEPLFVRDNAKQAVLEARGYTRTARTSIDHWYDLTLDLPPRRPLPSGFRIRSVAGPAEIEARVSVHRAAFAPSRMTVAKYRSLMEAPTYRRELDLVVETSGWPEGVPVGDEGCADSPCFAAFTIVWYDEIQRMGVFEPVGCRPEFQRRRFASAVIIEGMHLLKALGATNCWIGADGDSPGARTYAALGGYPAQPYEWWARTLKPAATPLAPES